MHPVRQSERDGETSPPRPLSTEGMRFVNDDDAAIPFRHRDDVRQRAERAVGAVDGVHNDDTGAVLTELALQMLRAVVAERPGRGPSRSPPPKGTRAREYREIPGFRVR